MFFSENGTHKTKEILQYSHSRSYMEVRLNGPCGKFKLTNTADDHVDLTLGDIPDAGFSEEQIEHWSLLN